jgi:hypothetical protein
MLEPQLNQSCQRCKEKKIRCDYKDPCSTCIIRGVGQVCLRLPRKTRIRQPRRRKQPQGEERRLNSRTNVPVAASWSTERTDPALTHQTRSSGTKISKGNNNDDGNVARARTTLRCLEKCELLLRRVYVSRARLHKWCSPFSSYCP